MAPNGLESGQLLWNISLAFGRGLNTWHAWFVHESLSLKSLSIMFGWLLLGVLLGKIRNGTLFKAAAEPNAAAAPTATATTRGSSKKRK